MGWSNWFKKKNVSPPTKTNKEASDQGPPMHLLALDPRSGAGPNAVRTTEEITESTILSLPAVTTNGRISFLSAGKAEDYNRLVAEVQSRVSHLPKDSACYVCGAVSVMDPRISTRYLIFEVRSFSAPVPELEQIFLLLTNLRTVGDDNWIKTEKYLQSEPGRSWINRFIDGLKQRINWTQLVESALESHGEGIKNLQ